MVTVNDMWFSLLYQVPRARKLLRLSERQIHRHLSMRSVQSRYPEGSIRNRRNDGIMNNMAIVLAVLLTLPLTEKQT